ncbi:hypothetical protein JTB14_005488 [Gonioctena quinquepunctata]|nr:hypothetical protein JTB14_005488 [Gonioctena quinquepunctata]
MYLVATKCLIASNKFLVVPAADRNSAIIEKQWKLVCAGTLGDVQKCIVSARHERPFEVMQMVGAFVDFDNAAESVINTKKLGISNVCQIRIDREQPGPFQTKKTYSILESWEVHRVLKPHVTSDHQVSFFHFSCRGIRQ